MAVFRGTRDELVAKLRQVVAAVAGRAPTRPPWCAACKTASAWPCSRRSSRTS